MKNILPAVLMLAATIASAHAAECPDRSAYAPAREIVAELNRIVAPSGVQDSYKTRIGGIEQWLNVRGQDKANPLVLFVHGGPAAPITPSMWQFQRPLEEYFTIANWDQRGAGRSYGEASEAQVADSIHIEQYVADAIEVAEHLRQRYGKQKLILMGHSWGTVVGMHAALRRPDLFHAYVGIGQFIDSRENERISFEYGLQQARAHGNAKAIAELESIAPYPGDQPITRERIIVARTWPQYYGGLSAFRDNSDYYYRAPRLSPDYTDADRCAINDGNVLTLGRLLPELLEVDFSGVTAFPVPVVMLLGRHDYTTPSAPVAAWLEQVEAPYKQAVWFERSAHMMPWEEPGKTLVSLLQHVRPLAIDGETQAPGGG
ncbi:alpha/beta hydrolase [Flavobacterium sp. MXW15]|uniref:Proline iminopeptidase n=1 Tax=Xanthomonas chitinilytica TaxID=2989819 RepID=A0ABT3JUV4_9XANT|nr:alpha/beta hydrolase [Xanthomonas sp. H13-6]MCW4453381.1 alpha/beta hydrolase [Flavobacterium sp. MXW15]MCW4472266.1 alpha/beta hydrolase [Xanthomonas sp. H13-6]